MFNELTRNYLLKLASIIYSNIDSKVLFYHDIHNQTSYCDFSTPLDVFKMHIDTIKKANFEIVNKISKKQSQVLIQFDDGYKGILDCIPYIESEKIPVEIFIITNFIGKKNYLSEQELKYLDSSDLVKLSSHSHTHKRLSHCDLNTISEEIEKSKSILESICRTEINSICYPFGLFSDEVVRSCKMAGYTNQYSSLPGSYFDPFLDQVYRRNLVQSASKNELRLILLGANNIFKKRYLKQHYKK